MFKIAMTDSTFWTFEFCPYKLFLPAKMNLAKYRSYKKTFLEYLATRGWNRARTFEKHYSKWNLIFRFLVASIMSQAYFQPESIHVFPKVSLNMVVGSDFGLRCSNTHSIHMCLKRLLGWQVTCIGTLYC